MTTTAMETSTIGGLSHLVDAAAALTKLIDGPKDTSSEIQTVEAPPMVEPRSLSGDEDVVRKSRTSSRETFPQRLFQMLADSSISDAISWLPDGCSFVIFRPDVFSSCVLPLYFHSRASTKYPSFTRKLNRWGFRQATKGPDTGAFYHPLFRRDQPQQCLGMECQKSPRNRRPSAASTGKRKTTKALNTSFSAVPLPTSQDSNQQEALKSGTLLKTTLPTFQPARRQHLPETATVSADDRSLSSGGGATSPTQQSSQIILSPCVPSDPLLVAATLQAQQQREKLAVAKAELYEAYQNALKQVVG